MVDRFMRAAASFMVWRVVLVHLDRYSLHRSNIRYRCRRHHGMVGYVSDVVAVVDVVSLNVVARLEQGVTVTTGPPEFAADSLLPTLRLSPAAVLFLTQLESDCLSLEGSQDEPQANDPSWERSGAGSSRTNRSS